MTDGKTRDLYYAHGSVFRVTAARGAIFSASVTVTQTVTYMNARCPTCNRLVMAVPGVCRVETRSSRTRANLSGLGPVVVCKCCGDYVEVITHG